MNLFSQVYQSLTMPSVYFRHILCADPCVKHRCNLVKSPSKARAAIPVVLLYKLMGTTDNYESHSGKVTVGTSLSGEVKIKPLISTHSCEKMKYFAFR